MSDATNQTSSAAAQSSRQLLPEAGKLYRVTNRSGVSVEVELAVFNSDLSSFSKDTIFVQSGGTPKLPPNARVSWSFLLRNPKIQEHTESAA